MTLDSPGGALPSWRYANMALGKPPPVPVGAKARGLLSLPHGWTPPFVALTESAAAGLVKGRAAREVVAELRELCRRAEGRALLVRSDGPSEMLRPGEGVSRVSAAALGAITSALASVLEAGEDERPGALVQVAVQPAVVGMLSNEGRVTPDIGRWLVEGELEAAPPAPKYLRAQAGSQDDALTAPDAASVLDALAGVAAYLLQQGPRRRCEWLWDAERVWIVQADVPPQPKAALAPPGSPIDDTARPTLGSLSGDAGFAGRKLARWHTFVELGWTRPPLGVVAGTTWSGPGGRERAKRLLAAMGPGPVVVRTDMTAAADADALLLPTSPPDERCESLLAFMADTATRLDRLGVAPDHWAFLISALVRCQASAWVGARPGDPEVRVESLWGYPDGLLHLPHDAWTVGPSGVTRASVIHKPACQLPHGGEWQTLPVSPPFDWQPTLESAELLGMSALARQLADHVRCQVQLMVLARIGGRRGPDALMAFHFTELAEPQRSADARLPGREREEVILRRPGDLERLIDARPPLAIRVRPDPAHLRDVAFLKRVGAWAAQAGVAIVFSGSLLGHAYHLLGSAGATVVPADEKEGTQADDGEQWSLVVDRRSASPARVRALPQSELHRLAAAALARLAYSDPAVDSSLRVETVDVALALLDPPRPARPGAGFAGLVGVHGAPPGPDRPGRLPLFMDDAPPAELSGAASVTLDSIPLPTMVGLPIRLRATDGRQVGVTFTADGRVQVALPAAPDA